MVQKDQNRNEWKMPLSFFIGFSGRKNKSFNRPTASDQVEASLRSGWDKCFITSSEERTNPMTWTSWPNQPVPSTVRDFLGDPQLRNDQTNPTLQTPEQLEVFIQGVLAKQDKLQKQPYLVYRRSHSAAVDKEPYPQGYTVPSWKLFDGRS